MDTHHYNTRVVWNVGRTGNLSSPELNESFAVATPPNFKSGVANIWSPEHLFTAAINSCFMTTFLAIAENSNLVFTSFSCDASGKLEAVDGRYRMTEVELMAKLEIENEADLTKAQRVLEKSEKACLISNSVTAKVNLKMEVTHAQKVVS